MKYDTLKNHVIANVRSSIIEGRDWNTMATILLDKCLSGKPKKFKAFETFNEYADFATTVIENWDIRHVENLREVFPNYFPKSLSSGKLTCELAEDGWHVFKLKT